MCIRTPELHTRVHSSVVRAADCRSAGPWFKSGCALCIAPAKLVRLKWVWRSVVLVAWCSHDVATAWGGGGILVTETPCCRARTAQSSWRNAMDAKNSNLWYRPLAPLALAASGYSLALPLSTQGLPSDHRVRVQACRREIGSSPGRCLAYVNPGIWVHSSVVRAADCRSAGPWF